MQTLMQKKWYHIIANRIRYAQGYIFLFFCFGAGQLCWFGHYTISSALRIIGGLVLERLSQGGTLYPTSMSFCSFYFLKWQYVTCDPKHSAIVAPILQMSRW